MNTWSHLPNAPHIDHILELVNLELVHGEHGERWTIEWDKAWDAAWHMVIEGSRAKEYDVLISQEHGSRVCWEIGGLLLALIAWDHASSYLSLTTDKIRTLALLGDNIAVLILPAAIILENKNENFLFFIS